MATANGTTAGTATRTTAQGFGLACPKCLDKDNLTIDPNDLRKLSCGACGEDFTAAEALALLSDQAKRWDRFAKWFSRAPQHISGSLDHVTFVDTPRRGSDDYKPEPAF